MKNLIYLLPLFAVILFIGCDDDTGVLPQQDTGDINLNFRAMFGADELDFNTTVYPYDGMEMTFSKFDFYISDVALFRNVDGIREETELFEIDFIDLTQNNNAVSIEAKDIPVGEYDGLVFSIGVPSDLNSQLPADFSSTHPLGFTADSHYWHGWSSYIFSKTEGRLDTSGNGDYVSFSYHIGSDAFFKGAIEKNLAINLEVGETQNINFEYDIQNLLENGGALDIVTFPNSHSLDEVTAATHVSNNIPSSITVQ